jgi:peptidoglycan hydrolase-like protein with peptidoglycan-binding domain
VDDEAVVLLTGALPMYRTLRAGDRGADVAQLEGNLQALGYTGFTVDEEFTASTAAAVRSWQRAVNLPQTGQVGPEQVLYAGGAVRIADHRRSVGEPADGDIIAVTGLTVVVTGAVDASRLRHDIEVGAPVSILLPDGAEAPATVRTTGPPPVDPQGTPPQEEIVLVEAEPVDGAALAGREGPVTLRFVVAQRRDVLAVPVIALVALAEGGYGVQVVEGGSSRYVAVSTGLFARGYVEITEGDLRPGMRVVVPASVATP